VAAERIEETTCPVGHITKTEVLMAPYFQRLGWASLQVLAFGTLASILGLATVGIAEAETVVFAGWGGSIQQGQREVYFDSFEKATGIKVIDVAGVSLPKIKAMVETGNVEWDVVQSLGMWIKPGEAAGYWEDLDYKTIDKSGVPDFLVRPHAIGNTMYGMVLAYNTKGFAAGKEPKSWQDYWNVEGFLGRRGMLDAPRYTLELALLAAGTPNDKLYPLDVDKAFASLDKIKGKIDVWWKQWPQAPQLLASQEIVMTLTSHTRIYDLQKNEKAPVAMSWSNSLLTVDSLSVIKGSKNKDAAMKLVNWMTRPDLQAEFARKTTIGPVNQKALESLNEQVKESLPTYHYAKGEMVAVDNDWWAANLDKMEERWNSWKLQ
jgi:putative spermidine/putrescine transport system substrate-binding protein